LLAVYWRPHSRHWQPVTIHLPSVRAPSVLTIWIRPEHELSRQRQVTGGYRGRAGERPRYDGISDGLM